MVFIVDVLSWYHTFDMVEVFLQSDCLYGSEWRKLSCYVKDRNFWHICHQDLCFQCKEEHVIHLDTLHNTWKIYKGKYTYALQSEKCVRLRSRFYNRYCETCEVLVREACSEHISAVAAVCQQCQCGVWICQQRPLCPGLICQGK